MESNQDKSSEHRVLLIDLDNCPRQIQMLPQTLSVFSRIIACYGGEDPKVHLRLVSLLATAINEGKLEIVGMEKKGKNAADFGLAFWAGRLMAEMPPETEFVILSQDADLDHIINMLRKADRKAERINGKAKRVKKPHALKDNQEPLNGTTNSLIDEAIEKYTLQHLQTDNSRPRKKATLLNSIKAFFKKRKWIKTEDILQGLVERGILHIDEKGRVTYPKHEPELDSSSFLSDDSGEIPF